ncbi:hypothetical protein Nepgr_025271 [Nepenthes gracilis]|uniref:Uncharacterized protein n=1 Tax=Nepenthes gracilis TaxID=150966 RepID=A0AAD3XZI8_NEPGR|nr:hypothetical protein Nepgr_025271 [Nepenthes gracilis]
MAIPRTKLIASALTFLFLMDGFSAEFASPANANYNCKSSLTKMIPKAQEECEDLVNYDTKLAQLRRSLRTELAQGPPSPQHNTVSRGSGH